MLIKSDPNSPSPVVKPPFAEKSKKPLFYKLLLGSAALGIVIFPTAQVHAGFFSSVSALFGSAFTPHIPTTSAQGISYNSQTIRLLEPAVNIDPNPSKGDGDITVAEGGALLPESGPSGTTADILERPATSEISVYVVHRGDTLAEIAAMFNVSKQTIIWANDLGSKGVIHEGQSLVILPITGVSHTVAKGDTVASIAKKYKADADEIRAYNDIADGEALAVGDVVIIPDGEVQQVVATTPAKKKSTATTKNPYRGGSGADLGGFFVWPADGGVVTQGLHGYNGIDIGVPTGTAIYAAAGGTVIISRNSGWNGGYGDYIVISHDNGVQTLYGHLSRTVVQTGARVEQGDIIGYSGMTGKATGPHLHFEVRGAKNPFAK